MCKSLPLEVITIVIIGSPLNGVQELQELGPVRNPPPILSKQHSLMLVTTAISELDSQDDTHVI